jgi:hypothetical protein
MGGLPGKAIGDISYLGNLMVPLLLNSIHVPHRHPEDIQDASFRYA